ncbi:lipid-A-disaccharide synthase [Thiobacillus denitrificans]|uniref:Lipid-A-disaccharide synthase n=1 Tax=Thiobacillus denitrificans TaxID=36861 RepID=A0A106BJ12_THIDE|nr:lipid-A-disaccharide synthase [Thiobacillus denitrificans]KVW93386.1 lipid-A-disaccharide synthase [Thiobacillus denitrificans]
MDLGVVAGEASGDLLGAHFIAALKQRHPGLRAAGIAGPRMVEAGVEAVYPSDKLAVNGYVEVLRHLPELLWIRSRITRYFLRERPRVFVGIDAPDFNFTLEAKLKQAGIPTVHFVSPSIWAWRPERIHRIRQAVSHMLVVFPFEAQIYRDAGIPVTYVGHPLADVIPLQPDTAAARMTLGLAAGPVIALLPGSRLSEVTRHARLMLDAAVRIRQRHPDAQFVLPAANAAAARLVRQAMQGLDLPLRVLDGQSHTALAACDVALVASGTATLEAALFKKPMVITYRVPALTAYLMRKKALLPWIGLPNILARDFVVPERVQEAATPENLANDALAWLDDAPRREAVIETFRAMHLSLRQDASARIAKALEPYLERA